MSAYFFLFAEQKRFGVSGMDGPSTVTNAANTSRDLAFAIMLDLPTLWTGAIGGWGLGWLDTPMPAVVTMLTSAVFVAVSIVSFRYYDAKKVIAVLLIVAALIAIPLRTISGDPTLANRCNPATSYRYSCCCQPSPFSTQ
jgi:hypothetical protein